MTKYTFALMSVTMVVVACVQHFCTADTSMLAAQTAFGVWLMATACWFSLNE